MKVTHLRWLPVIFLLYSGFAFGVIEGKGGFIAYHSFTDYGFLRGKIPGLPAAGAEPSDDPTLIARRGVSLTYFGLKGYSDAIYPLRPGVELPVGFNLLTPNTVLSPISFAPAVFLQFMPVSFLGFELNLGYNFLVFLNSDSLFLGHVYTFPKLFFEIHISQYIAMTFFGGLFLPIDRQLWEIYIDSPTNVIGLKGLMGLLTVGLTFVISEDIFSL